MGLKCCSISSDKFDNRSDLLISFQIKEMGAVIGFDARFDSRRWATLAAGIFLRMGFKNVRLFSQITPTPFVPFTVVQKEASIGIMVTASHNPKEDNGYKVFWRNGAQVRISSDVAENVSHVIQINENLTNTLCFV